MLNPKKKQNKNKTKINQKKKKKKKKTIKKKKKKSDNFKRKQNYSKGQFHVCDLFLGKLNSDDGFAERLLNPRFKSISCA